MHGGHLVEECRFDNVQPRLEQLGADHHGEGAAEQEHGEAEPQVQRADILVVGGQHPAHQALGGTVGGVLIVAAMAMVIDHCTHVLSPTNGGTAWPGSLGSDRFSEHATELFICCPPPASAPVLPWA